MKLQKITPYLWFDNEAEDAVKFYTTVFKDSSIGRITRYGKAGYEFHRKPEGTIMTIDFELQGQLFVALNGGPQYKFNEAISLSVSCESQEEVDYYWEKLGEGGDPKAQVCGWLKDKFGVSWQVVPAILNDMVSDAYPEKSQSVLNAMFPMKKLDIATLKKAFDNH